MKFSKLGLLTLLISLFILSSCKNQDGIGLGVDDGSQLNGSILVDTSLVLTTVKDDSLITAGLFKVPLSYFKDPEFGTTESNIAAALSLPGGVAYTLPGGDIVVDSAILVLPYSDGFYGDSLTSRFKVNVNQLDERVVAGKAYSNVKEWAHSSTIIGTKSFIARPHDTLKITSILKGRVDTMIKVSPQIRIPISPSFFVTNFFEAPASWRATNTAFQAGLKGVYVTLDQAQTTGPGGNIMLKMDSARVSLYFRSTKSGTIDTTLITFPVQSGLHAANIKHTYSAKVNAAINTPAADGSVYLQALAGLRAKMTFPNVKNIFASVGNVVINRAELIVKVAPGSNIPYRQNQKLTLYQLDIAKQRIRLQDATTTDPRGQNGPSFFGGYYNPTTGEYHFTVTGYLQDLIQGKTVDNGTYLAPVDPTAGTAVDIAPTAQYAERTIVGGKNSPYRARLSIIYTKVNQ